MASSAAVAPLALAAILAFEAVHGGTTPEDTGGSPEIRMTPDGFFAWRVRCGTEAKSILRVSNRKLVTDSIGAHLVLFFDDPLAPELIGPNILPVRAPQDVTS